MIVAAIVLSAVALGGQAQAPAGWEDASRRAGQLILDHKIGDAIAVYQRIVRQAPEFQPARYELADALRLRALETTMRSRSATAGRQDFELAETHYRFVRERGGEYRQLAVMKLVSLYGEDELNKPAELVDVTREYVQLSPASAVARIMLAKALKATGQEREATSALLAARAAVPATDARLLATLIVEHVVTSVTTPPAELRTLLAYAEPVIDRELKQEPDSRDLLMTKAAAALFRAEKLETNPSRKRAAKAEADRFYERFRIANGSGLQTSADIMPVPAAPGEPAGYAAARDEADRLIRRREFAAAARAYESVISAAPAFLPAHYMRLAALVMAGQPAPVDQALKAARSAVPATAESRHMAATYLFGIVSSNKDMTRADARKLLVEADAMATEALKLEPDYLEAIIYRSVILRRRAEFETDPAAARSLKAEADRLSQRARELSARK